MKNVFDIYQNFIEEFEDALQDCKHVHASDVGLDYRCGSLWIDIENELIISNDYKMLDYYGGFEYVDPDCVISIGEYKIYQGDDSRVHETIMKV